MKTIIFKQTRDSCDTADGAYIEDGYGCDQCRSKESKFTVSIQYAAESGAELCFNCLEAIYLAAKSYKGITAKYIVAIDTKYYPHIFNCDTLKEANAKKRGLLADWDTEKGEHNAKIMIAKIIGEVVACSEKP